jgi:hypothetical protein
MLFGKLKFNTCKDYQYVAVKLRPYFSISSSFVDSNDKEEVE